MAATPWWPITDEWAEDAARRDFTINALYAAGDGEIFDYATGVEDLIAGRVRFIGDARTRIAEDYLRVLRLFRFHAWYGKGEMDAEAPARRGRGQGQARDTFGERIAKEMLRLLEAGNPAPVLRVMAAAGILPELLPGALQLPRLERLVQIDADNFFVPDAVLRLAALLPDDGAAARARGGAAATCPTPTATRLEQALARRGARCRICRRGMRGGCFTTSARRAFRDRVLLQWAGARRAPSALAWRMLLQMAESWQRPRFPLTGREVMEAGVPEGPEVGRILAEVEDWWIDR